jgi:RNA polymerase sigma factor (TIGR02999 family)
MGEASEQVTEILQAVGAGDERAAEKLLPLVYDELRRLAAARMAQEAPGQTLQPTALVHEAWLRLVGSGNEHWNSRGHFFGAAAEAMRRILIDRARKRHRERHGHGLVRIDISQLDVAITTDDELLLRVNEALEKLEAEAPERAQLVKLRFFTGLSIPEAAEALGIATATANRYWAFARAWLLAELQTNE